MMAGALAFGIGFLVAASVPASQPEVDASAKLMDTLDPVKQGIAEAAHELVESVKEPAMEAGQHVTQTALRESKPSRPPPKLHRTTQRNRRRPRLLRRLSPAETRRFHGRHRIELRGAGYAGGSFSAFSRACATPVRCASLGSGSPESEFSPLAVSALRIVSDCGPASFGASSGVCGVFVTWYPILLVSSCRAPTGVMGRRHLCYPLSNRTKRGSDRGKLLEVVPLADCVTEPVIVETDVHVVATFDPCSQVSAHASSRCVPQEP